MGLQGRSPNPFARPNGKVSFQVSARHWRDDSKRVLGIVSPFPRRSCPSTCWSVKNLVEPLIQKASSLHGVTTMRALQV